MNISLAFKTGMSLFAEVDVEATKKTYKILVFFLEYYGKKIVL